MKDLTTVLRDGDPAANDPGLSPLEVATMRRIMLTAVRPQPMLAAPWHHPLAVAAVVALTLASGVLAGRHMPPPARSSPSSAPAVVHEGERRQLHFATPGGTRIIWVFDSEFDLKETTP